MAERGPCGRGLPNKEMVPGTVHHVSSSSRAAAVVARIGRVAFISREVCSMIRVDNQMAVVTGGSQGLGLATTLPPDLDLFEPQASTNDQRTTSPAFSQRHYRGVLADPKNCPPQRHGSIRPRPRSAPAQL